MLHCNLRWRRAWLRGWLPVNDVTYVERGCAQPCKPTVAFDFLANTYCDEQGRGACMGSFISTLPSHSSVVLPSSVVAFAGVLSIPPCVSSLRSDTRGFARSWLVPIHRILHPLDGMERVTVPWLGFCGRGWDLIAPPPHPTAPPILHASGSYPPDTSDEDPSSLSIRGRARRGLVSTTRCVLDWREILPHLCPDGDVPCGGRGPQARVVQLRRSREVTAMAMAPAMALPCTRASWPTSRARHGKTCPRMIRTDRRRLRPPTSAEVRAGSKARTSTSRKDVWDRKDGVLLEDWTSADGFGT